MGGKRAPRTTISLPDKLREEIDQLQARLQAPTQAEAIRRALIAGVAALKRAPPEKP